MMNLRDSHILNHKQNLEWNWLLIATILKVCDVCGVCESVCVTVCFPCRVLWV